MGRNGKDWEGKLALGFLLLLHSMKLCINIMSYDSIKSRA